METSYIINILACVETLESDYVRLVFQKIEKDTTEKSIS
jgi:hypothetical protein